MRVDPSRSLTLTPRGGSGPTNAPAATNNASAESAWSLARLMNAASSYFKPGDPGIVDPLARQTLERLRQPNTMAAITPLGWQALARAWQAATPASQANWTADLKAANVTIAMSDDGRYVMISDANTDVLTEPLTQKTRISNKTTAQAYRGDRLVQTLAFDPDGNRVEAVNSRGTEVWYTDSGKVERNGVDVKPRQAAWPAGEAPRRARPPSSNELIEPPWVTGTDMAIYGPLYDQAVRDSGGMIVEPALADEGQTDAYNCHAYGTTDGAGDIFDPYARAAYPHWLNNPMAQLQNGPFAKLADTQRVHVGDIVVYRTPEGTVTHTGVVRAVDPDGNPSWVESKFGELGLYVHRPEDVPGEYGAASDFFRPDAR